ncbi:hypothetical protein AVEN_207674-1 [Araneus ventricosus]|uniref:Uncharacterized protein n=1 Tax=Araneus ventricosus TaxID=182803 RepID=A0A4Y2LQ76_ARAVE|nr:hypothetical protein AVEN_207674-1 [Araneus ventricosus]
MLQLPQISLQHNNERPHSPNSFYCPCFALCPEPHSREQSARSRRASSNIIIATVRLPALRRYSFKRRPTISRADGFIICTHCPTVITPELPSSAAANGPVQQVEHSACRDGREEYLNVRALRGCN